ncbi:MAG: hypothetical protein WB439_15430 [Acidobacteriaceae bacterium]
MLDVYPPEHTPHTWRDFFIHIATIVVGLCIAVGLEQTVELIHHHHQLHEARAAIHAELEYNQNLLTETTAILTATQQTMQHNAALLRSPTTTANVPTSALIYKWDIGYPRSNAWQDAKASSAVDYMTPSERASADFIYGDGDLAEKFAMSWLEDNNIAAAIVHRAHTLGELTPTERDQLLQVTARTEGELVSYQNLIHWDQDAIKRYLSFPAQSGKQVE